MFEPETHCDICQKAIAIVLDGNTLKGSYSTSEIKHLCDDCALSINDFKDAKVSEALKYITTLVKEECARQADLRGLDTKREEEPKLFLFKKATYFRLLVLIMIIGLILGIYYF